MRKKSKVEIAEKLADEFLKNQNGKKQRNEPEVRVYCCFCIDQIPDFWSGTVKEWVAELSKTKEGEIPNWLSKVKQHQTKHNKHVFETMILGKRRKL